MEPLQGYRVTLGVMSDLSLSSLPRERQNGLPSQNVLRIKIIRIKGRHLMQCLAQSNLLSNICYPGIEGLGDDHLDGKPAPLN